MGSLWFEEVFAEEWAKTKINLEDESGYVSSEWMTAGFRPKQNEQWWYEHGPGMAKAYAEWYESSPVSVWVTPDDQPAVELELDIMFGEHPVKMVVDQVLRAGTALLIVDFKTGSRQPVDPQQLGWYASGIEVAYGIRPRYGAYFMARGIRNNKDDTVRYLTEPIDLGGERFSVSWYAKQLDQLDRAEEAGVYMPHVTELCRMCGVNRACAAYGGAEAAWTDPDHSEWLGHQQALASVKLVQEAIKRGW